MGRLIRISKNRFLNQKFLGKNQFLNQKFSVKIDRLTGINACGVPSPTILYPWRTSAPKCLTMYSYVFGNFRMNAFRLSESNPYMITLSGMSLAFFACAKVSLLRRPVKRPFQYCRLLVMTSFWGKSEDDISEWNKSFSKFPLNFHHKIPPEFSLNFQIV